MIIIGITGTLGAGKGTVVEYLKQQFGFMHLSVRDFLVDLIEKRGLTVNRDSMVTVANELRKKNGPSFIVDELFSIAKKRNARCVIESIRTPGEVYSLKGKGVFFLLAIDADPEIRYQRIKIRNSVTDKVDFMEFVQNEKREYETNDPHKQNLKKCISLADFAVINNGSKEELLKKIDRILNQISVQ